MLPQQRITRTGNVYDQYEYMNSWNDIVFCVCVWCNILVKKKKLKPLEIFSSFHIQLHEGAQSKESNVFVFPIQINSNVCLT